MVRSLIIYILINLFLSVSTQAKSQTENEVIKYKGYTKYLNDPKNKISENFKAHPDIMPRVHFWFNIYTKFSSKDHVIHHTLHPWIVYEIVDTSSYYTMYKNQTYAAKMAKQFVRGRKALYRKKINKLARLKKFTKLSKFELAILNKIKYLGKNYRQNLWIARKNVRTQTGQNDFFHKGIIASSEYNKHIKSILKEHGLPLELASLPLLESSFNLKAKSKVGASGVWQIMPNTAKQYGHVSWTIDERNSPLKATTMAAKLMKFNYGQLKNWPLAITAYNNGIGNIRKAMKRAKTNNPYKLINNHKRGSFGFASSNFYASFLAAVYVKSYSKEIFKVKALQPLSFDTVYFKRSTSLRHITRNTGVSLKKIKKYNLDLKSRVGLSTFLPRNFKLFLPIGSAKKLLNKNIHLVNIKRKKVISDSKS